MFFVSASFWNSSEIQSQFGRRNRQRVAVDQRRIPGTSLRFNSVRGCHSIRQQRGGNFRESTSDLLPRTWGRWHEDEQQHQRTLILVLEIFSKSIDPIWLAPGLALLRQDWRCAPLWGKLYAVYTKAFSVNEVTHSLRFLYYVSIKVR